MTEIRLNIDQQLIYSASEIICCRICHEAEFESSKSLEAPCSCSGTVKFAHRDCIQRWCDEKGNTNCEICLQKFEPGYTAPLPKKASQETHVTIRESLEASRTAENLVIIAIADEEESLVEREYAECSSTADATASLCRTLALITFYWRANWRDRKLPIYPSNTTTYKGLWDIASNVHNYADDRCGP
ncbi:hypothetical protein E3N88_36584 [Mikania micrantha]|uniref:RING-CH-type domain-containing protein n=1 Tax=Mikania micrantha TaxID=192012 RepID=A0A5N6M430_9ASTR|nr:hypothetical protein E3N88_36584 [Mikania micrantha]